MDLFAKGSIAKWRSPRRIAAAVALLTAVGTGLVLLNTADAAPVTPAPGAFSGSGFDACTAPSEATMKAWLKSPYRAMGIYIGGVNRGCAQANLTTSWVSKQQAAGWHLLPIYVGLQAPCSTSSRLKKMDPATASAQGRAAAEDAVARARAVGLPKESAIILDMEAYPTSDPACRTAVQVFTSSWTSRLHDLSYLSGFYSSMSSGVADQVAVYEAGNRVHPDYLFFARWDGVATVSDAAIPDNYWASHRRIKQYRGDHTETYGGVTINIDSDYFDVRPVPATRFGDFTGNGWSDLLTRDSATGRLHLYPGNGSVVNGPVKFGLGWNGMSAMTRFGDFNRDGFEDLIVRESATGYLWLYPGTGSSFKSRVRIGHGWNVMREITAVGDLDRDGFTDLLAVQESTGQLMAYRGKGTGFATTVSLGAGWNEMDELAGVGDFNGDGFNDLVAREISTGTLYLYPGAGLKFGERVQLAADWSGLREITGVGDFDRDGHTDLLAIQKSTDQLIRYLGSGTGLADGVAIGTKWGSQQPLF